MINIQILKRIENLETQIQSMKWAILSCPAIKPKTKSEKDIVELTSGLLGKSFPRGTAYENKMRSFWKKHMQKIGL